MIFRSHEINENVAAKVRLPWVQRERRVPPLNGAAG